MTYKELLKLSSEQYGLSLKEVDYLLKYYFKLDYKETAEFDNDMVSLYIEKAKQLSSGVPIQYVVGNVDFYGYLFDVNSNVLIPRFVTEQLVSKTIDYIKKYFKKTASLIDIATGSGVIGITMKKELPNLNVTLTDISEEALKVANKNAEKLAANVNIYQSDMLNEVINKDEKYDILISNPPYLTPDEEIMESVKKYEPSIALYGGNNGLEYYEKILSRAKNIINDKALIAFEIGANQATSIVELASKYFDGTPYEIVKDFEGRDRMFFLFYNLDV